MKSTDAPSEWTLLPGKLTAPVLRFTTYDATLLGCLALSSLILFRLFSMPGAIAGVGVIYLLMMQREYARQYDMMFVHMPSSFWLRRAHKGINWQPGSKKSALPYQLKDIPGTAIGLAFNVDSEQEVSIALSGSGSHIANMSIKGMKATHRRLSDDLNKIGVKRGLEVTVGFVFRLRPWDEFNHREFASENFNGNHLYPKLVAYGDEATDVTVEDKVDAAQYEYNEQLYQVFNEAGCTKPTMAVILTIKRKRISLFKKAETEAIYEDEVARQPIIQIANRAVAMLRNRTVQDVHILNLDELREYFREAWDEYDLDDYRYAVRTGNLLPHGHWPQQLIATTKSRVQTDRTHHGLIRITETAEAASPTHLLQLYGGPCKSRTVSMVTQSMRSKGDYWLTGIVIDVTEGIREFIGMGRLRPGARAKAQERASHEEASYNIKYRQLYDYFISVPASSERELDGKINDMLEYFDSCNNITAKRVETYETLLYPLTWRALTGVK